MKKKGGSKRKQPKTQTNATETQELFALGTRASRTGIKQKPTDIPNPSRKTEADVKKEKPSEKLNEELVYSVLKVWFEVEDINTRNAFIERKIITAFEELSLNTAEPNRYLFSSIAYLSAILPEIFTFGSIVQQINKLLSTQADMKQKQYNTKSDEKLPLLGCGVLYNAFKNRSEWPLSFFQSYMDDALNSRVWVQNEQSKLFVLNILTALPDSFTDPPSSAPNIANHPKSITYHSASVASCLTLPEEEQHLVVNRWPQVLRDRVKTFILEMIKYQLQISQETNRNFIKVLYTTASIPESRAIGSRFFEGNY